MPEPGRSKQGQSISMPQASYGSVQETLSQAESSSLRLRCCVKNFGLSGMPAWPVLQVLCSADVPVLCSDQVEVLQHGPMHIYRMISTSLCHAAVTSKASSASHVTEPPMIREYPQEKGLKPDLGMFAVTKP